MKTPLQPLSDIQFLRQEAPYPLPDHMQTFMPYDNFYESAWCLDGQRLNKQRIEAHQILKAHLSPGYGWQHHPAVKMWIGYDAALLRYFVACCDAWADRGGADNAGLRARTVASLRRAQDLRLVDLSDDAQPPWVSDEDFRLSHQANLVRKALERRTVLEERGVQDADLLLRYYEQFFPGVDHTLPYVWPASDRERNPIGD